MFEKQLIFGAKAFFALTMISFTLDSSAQSIQELQRRCANNTAQSCFELAIQEPSPSRAVEFAAKACDLNLTAACTFLGLKYASGDGVSRNIFYAVKLFEKACGGSGNTVGCQLFALALSEGEGIRQDKTRAHQILATLCNAGHLGSCGNLASFYHKGWTVQRDDTKAAELLARACQENAAIAGKFCYELALHYEFGLGVRMSKATALEFYGKACDRENAGGCQNYARLKNIMP